MAKKTVKNTYRLTFMIQGERKQYTAKTRKEADTIRIHVKGLIAAQKTGITNYEAEVWASKLDDGPLRRSLVSWGLIADPSAREKTIGDLRELVDLLPGANNTRRNRQQWVSYLLAFRPDTFRLMDFTPKTALEFCNRIREQYKAGESAERTIRGVKGFFKLAYRNDWIVKNPFEHCTSHKQASLKPVCRVSLTDLQKVLDACPNRKWRAIICLLRLAGLRGANELRNMDWSLNSIRWSNSDAVGTITVRPTKQAHIEKRKERIIPIHPILEKALLDWLQASGAEEKEAFPFVPMLPDIAEKMEIQKSKGLKEEINLNVPIKKIFNRAGVPLTVAYDLRKNCCSDWLTPDDSGYCVDLMVYEQMAGHSIEVGRKYYQQLFPDRREKGLERVVQSWKRQQQNAGIESEVLERKDLRQKASQRFGQQLVSEMVSSSRLQEMENNPQNSTQPLINREFTQEMKKPLQHSAKAILPPRGVEPL